MKDQTQSPDLVNCKKIAKLILYVLCTVLLIWQSTDLIIQFAARETQINVDYSYQDKVIPGITVCYPRAISLFNFGKIAYNMSNKYEKILGEFFGQDKSLYDIITDNDFDQFNEYYNKKMKNGDKKIQDAYHEFMSINESAQQELGRGNLIKDAKITFVDSLYWGLSIMMSMVKIMTPNEWFNSSILYNKVTVNEETLGAHHFRKLTSSYKKLRETVKKIEKMFRYPIEVSVSGLKLNGNGKFDKNVSTIVDEEPIESIIFNDNGDWNKCFTFYSHLKPKWRYMPMLVQQLNIDVVHKPLWYPSRLFKSDGYTFSMHNPDDFAQDFIRIDSFKDIKMEYQVLITKQGDSKSIVNCKDYNLDSDHYNERTRYDCVKKCLQDMQDKCSNCSQSAEAISEAYHCLFEGPYQWTREQMPWNDTMILRLNEHPHFGDIEGFGDKTSLIYDPKTDCDGSLLHFDKACKNICRPQCKNRQYKYEIKSRVRDAISRVEVVHSKLSDQLSSTTPKMSWIDFFSQLGGLFGLWLGLSLYAISDYLLKLFRYLTRKLFTNIIDNITDLVNLDNRGKTRQIITKL